MAKALFPDAPENVNALGDERLTDLLGEFQSVSRLLKAGEVDLAEHYGEDMSRQDASAAAMSEWRDAADTVQAIRAELAARQSAVEAFQTEADALDAEFAVAEDTAEAVLAEITVDTVEVLADATDIIIEEIPEETVSVDEEAAVIAAAPAPSRVLFPAVPKKHRADVTEAPRAVLVAAAGNTGIRPGVELDRISLAEAMIETARRRGPVTKHRNGTSERILLATADLPFPENRTLRSKDADGNSEKIRSIGSPFFGQREMQTLIASGGLCAPATPFYDLPQLSVASRPVRDALPGFRADRGAVSVPSVSTIGDISTAITVIEVADDALGGTFATKSCQAVDCATWTDVAVGAISHCREYGNLNARSWPEGIAHENELTMAAWARTAEGRLLDRIDSLSLSLSRTAVYGLSSTLLYALQVSRAGIISRLRMNPATKFQVLLPFWASQAFSADIINSQFGRFDTGPDAVAALLGKYGFAVTYHLDEALSGDTEVFPDETDNSAQDGWPSRTLIARLFPAGQFLYLDGGTLELGVVRDSTLNSTNDYEVFGESFENVARIGPVQAAHRLEIDVCPDGTVAAPDTSAFNCDQE